ncbi:MAG TPA: DUF5317 domain-containing protein [Candidatus Atribacteria bacterium]|nr:DUF5317 domain-containing protein [Candidatus Atribacteria bacterium]
MFISMIILAVLLGLLRGGRLANLTGIRLRYPLLILLSVIIEYTGLFLIQSGILSSRPVIFAFVVVHYVLLFAFIWLNRDLPYLWCAGAGSVLNFLVILVNKGSMPLSARVTEVSEVTGNLRHLLEGRFLTYHIINESTRLWFLGDVVLLPWPFSCFVSIGDIILYAGVFLLVQSVVAGGKKDESGTKDGSKA